MATITITDGDFGADLQARAGEDDFFVPDRARPGITLTLPFAEVAEIEGVADDHSARFREAGRLALEGVRKLGPLGLAASMFAISKPKDVKFFVRLVDDRRFNAVADAVTFAAIRSNFVRVRGMRDAEAMQADRVISKYMSDRKEAALASLLDTPPRRVAPPLPEPAPSTPPVERRAYAGPARPTFGRRGR